MGIALVLALGNAAIARLLINESSPIRLRRARWLETALDWAIVLGIIALFGHSPTTRAPALLSLLVLAEAVRWGWAGLLSSVSAAVLIVVGLVGTQAVALDIFEIQTARQTLAGWLVLIALVGLVGGSLLQGMGTHDRWGRARQEQRGTAQQRLESGLTAREWQLLPLLAQEDLTYDAIATQLYMSPKTVKVHVQHIGRKLEVSGRRKIVSIARQRGLLPPPTDTPADQ